MTSSQTFLQDQLQRKHEELQQLIVHQQDELRRVSEQLVMARYGVPIVNVALPFTTASVTIPTVVDGTLSETRKGFSQEQSLRETRPQNLSLSCGPNIVQEHHATASINQQQQQHHYHQHQFGVLQNQPDHNHHQHHLQYHHQLVDSTDLVSEDQSTTSHRHGAEEIISYMQLAPVSTVQQEYSHLLIRENTGGEGVGTSDNIEQVNVMLHHQENSLDDMT